MTKLKILITSFFTTIPPITKGLCSGLVATATTAAGGSAILSLNTPIELGIFVAGVAASCGAAYRLGQHMLELKNIALSLQEGQERFERIEKRLTRIEATTQKRTVDEN